MAYTQNGLVEASDYNSISRGYMNQNTGHLEGRIADHWGPGVNDHGLGQDISNITPPHTIPDSGWTRSYNTIAEMEDDTFLLGHTRNYLLFYSIVDSLTTVAWPLVPESYFPLNSSYYFRVDIGGTEYMATVDTTVVTTLGELLTSLNSQLGAQGFTFTLTEDTLNGFTHLNVISTVAFTYLRGTDNIDSYYDLFDALVIGFSAPGQVGAQSGMGYWTVYSPVVLSDPADLPPGSYIRTTSEVVNVYKQVSLDGRSVEPLVLNPAIHMTTGASVTALQWTALINAIRNCSSHAGISTAKGPSTVAGAIITHMADLENMSAVAYSSSGTTGVALSDSAATTVTYSTPWGLNVSTETLPGSGVWVSVSEQYLYFHFTVEFSSKDHLRYFFNAGGQVKVSFDRTGGSSTLINDEWSALAIDCGSIVIGYKDTTQVGGNNTGNVYLPSAGLGGFYDIYFSALYGGTSTNNHFTQNDNVGDYSSNSISVSLIYSNDNKLLVRVTCDNTGGMNSLVDGDTSSSVVVSYPADTYISNTWGTATVSGIASLSQYPPASGVYTQYLGSINSPPVVVDSVNDYISSYVSGIFKLDADLTWPLGITNAQIMCGVVYSELEGGGAGRVVIDGQVVHQFTVDTGAGDKINEISLDIANYINGVQSGDMVNKTGYIDSLDLSVWTTNNGNIGIFLESVLPTNLLTFDTFNTKFGWHINQPNFAPANGNNRLTTLNAIGMAVTAPYPDVDLIGQQPYSWTRWPDVANSSLYGTDRSSQMALNVKLSSDTAWSYDQDYAHYIQYDLGFSYDTDNSLPGLLYDGIGELLSMTEYGYSVPVGLSGVYVQPDKSVYPNGPVTKGQRHYPGIEATSGGGRIGYLNLGQPITYEQWFSPLSAAVGNAAVPTPAVYTLFGDQGQGPGAYDTGLSGNYVRGFAAGVFKIGATLSLPSAIPDSLIMCGVVYSGDESSGSGRIVINGVQIDTFTNSGSQTVTMSWETAVSNVGVDILGGLTGYCDSIQLNANASTISFNGSYTLGGAGPFDTKNVKFGVFIDQVTGAGNEVYVPTKEYTFKPPSMFVPHPYTEPFDWTTLASDILVDWETYYDFDRRGSIELRVNLGGYEPAWLTTDAPMNEFVSYDLGYHTDGNGEMFVDGATYDAINGLTTNITNTFRVPAYFYQQDDAVLNGVPTGWGVTSGGLRTFQGIESTNAWGGNGMISVPNFGMPFLYEQWFKARPASSGV